MLDRMVGQAAVGQNGLIGKLLYSLLDKQLLNRMVGTVVGQYG